MGFPLDRSCLNKLCKKPERRTSDEINRVICVVCGAPDWWLTTQARLDQDTDVLLKAHDNLRRILVALLNMIANPIRSPQLSEKISRELFAISELEIVSESAKMDVTPIENLFNSINILDYISEDKYMGIIGRLVKHAE
jgi:hypothetical protein